MRVVRRLVVVVAVLALLFGLVFGWGALKAHFIGKFLAQLPFAPQTVSNITASESTWQSSMSAVGSVVAINGANLSAQVSGIVDTINFESGDDVVAGQTLLTLRANNDPAVLAQLQATAAVDESNYDRDRKQFRADAVSAAQVDTDRATYLAAQAQVQGQLAEMAEKVVKAPFTGTLGIRQVNLGQYLAAGTNIVSLQQLDPLFVDFYLPQQALAQIRTGQAVSASIDAFPDRKFPGTISAINSEVDTATRTVQVRAKIANPSLLLRPGMFATVTIAVGSPATLVTLPQTAITYNPYGDTVYLLHKGTDHAGKPALIAQQTFVQLGDTRGDQVSILKGVSPGDLVVTAGQLKIHNGSTVTVNNAVPVPNSPNPNPPNE
ncbi:efflux RND transporter periplasmic adaptor subunit [Acidisoma sp.]|uniref:efflux RND transporter periplasmic adaptor subunit n=1 Tax=Acidisoma sp. TaxID=1872115 RepID=UPI003AFFAA41